MEKTETCNDTPNTTGNSGMTRKLWLQSALVQKQFNNENENFGESGGGGTGDKTMKISQRQLKNPANFQQRIMKSLVEQ